jgi:hypothetical protein
LALNESLRDALGEVQDRLASFEDKFTDFLEQTQSLTPRDQLSVSRNSMSRSLLIELIRTHFPWLEAPIVDNIVNGTLDVSHLIKVIPHEERSKVQITHPGISFDFDSGKPTVTTEFNVAYEKHFPNFASLNSALAVYCAVRSISDIDNTGIGFSISAHIRLLSSWYHLRYPWNGILMYEMAFLRKYQHSYEFSDWSEVRKELLTYHITRAALLPRPPSSKPSSYRPSDTTCKSFNSPTGCTYKSCVYKHICLNFRGNHPQPECKTKESSSN